MSNTIRNLLIINPRDKFRYNGLVLNKEGAIDFNVLIPMPQTIKDAPSNSIGTNEELVDIAKHFFNFEKYINYMNSISKVKTKSSYAYDELSRAPREVYIAFCERIHSFNKAMYGYIDWYDWELDKWGCKTNAYPLSKYLFETAWSTPADWLKELGRMLNFICLFADEDYGANLGIVISNGDFFEIRDREEGTLAATTFACTLHGTSFLEEAEFAKKGGDEERAKDFLEMHDNWEYYITDFIERNRCTDYEEPIINALNKLRG